ncbi:MAG: 16S rRNA (cytidine(1402)-2'-O)-methyltransferase [Lachnospiraceae bacterium]|jgi:16S rRNA (cytidine1402-2'-O)-methyltransferase|nr:16S rRNA (cytidine(1402)-2'-O)-methyltransferase [Lachnospiraceae bacterium]
MEDYGILYLVATPIGNLEDMTYRAVRILNEVDLIAAEDTRNSIKLLNHFEIHTKMTSYHEYNKIEKAIKLIEILKSGKNIALITDAGMPGISDPGEDLVRMCHENNVDVTVVPGASASVSALALSGLPSRRFVFEGFLPTEKKEVEIVLNRLKDETRTIILYEAPHRLKKTLNRLFQSLGDRKVSICKEITKKYENVMVTYLSEALGFYEDNTPKGEYVLVISGRDEKEIEDESREVFLTMSIDEHMDMYLNKGMDKKAAMKQVAKDRGVGKREIYQELIKSDDSR